MAVKLADWAFLTVAGLAFLVMIVGLIKPKWVLFWMKEPNRILISGVALIMFMVGWTGHSVLTVPKKPKSERERTLDELNDLNQGPSSLQR